MPRVTHVRKAQQRYETVVVDGKTVKDTSKPKPNRKCDFPGCAVEPVPGEILPGQAYFWIAPKTGPRSSTRKNRHEEHPSWHPWEYSSSMPARLAQISHDFWEEIDNVQTEDDVQSALDSAAERVRELAEEKRESASNIEDGFGHPTEKSEELAEIADSLESWADEITEQSIPDLPDPADRWFIEGPDGSRHGDDVGYETEDDARDALTGMIEDLVGDSDLAEDDFSFVEETPDEPSDDEIEEWRDQLRDELTLIDEPPV